jgi:ligand-binding SRPBCC domain-containing protein
MAIHVLQRCQILPIPLEECWDFFSDPRNLPKITPKSLDFMVLGTLPERMHPGLMIQYRVRPFLNLPVRWLTEITHVDPRRYFVDEQRVGPYRLWHHEHWFKSTAPRQTEVRDLVHYVLPFGPLGEVAHSLFVRGELRRIFDFREDVTRQLFIGEPQSTSRPA